MEILKKLARFILRTELQILQTNLNIKSKELEKEIQINKDLKNHFKKRSTPIDFYKILEENKVMTGDLMMLKAAYIRLKSWYDLNEKKYKEEFLPNYEHASRIKDDFFFDMVKLKTENEEYLEKIGNEVKSLEVIISKLKGIID